MEKILKEKIQKYWPDNIALALEAAEQLRQIELHKDISDISVTSERIDSIMADIVETDEISVLDHPSCHRQMISAVVHSLETGARELHWQDTQSAIKYAELIQAIGLRFDDTQFQAIGELALGDAMIRLGKDFTEAIHHIEKAADLFLLSGDLIGWARTSAGRLAVYAQNQDKTRLEEALIKAEQAQKVFAYFDQFVLHIRLTVNLLYMLYELGRYQSVIELFAQTLPTVELSGSAGEEYLGYLYNNVGLAHLYRGEFHQARAYFESATTELSKWQKPETFQVVPLNIAYIELAIGNYQKAMKLLHQLLTNMADHKSIYGIDAKMYMAEACLHLNRHLDAKKQAESVLSIISELEDDLGNHLAQTLCHLAAAETQLGQLIDAKKHLHQAETLFISRGAESWVQFARLLLAELAVLQQHYEEALQASTQLLSFYQQHGQLSYQVRTLLLQAKSSFALRRLDEGKHYAKTVIALARQTDSSTYRYRAHVLLGHISLAHGQQQRARRHYLAALLALHRLESYLTPTLRADFLDDKTEALHAFIPLCLADESPEQAFWALEQSKSQRFSVFLRQQAWKSETEESDQEILFQQFALLREKHHVLYQQVHDTTFLSADYEQIPLTEVTAELNQCETELKELAEQLQLFTHQNGPAHLPDLSAIQSRLQTNEVLLSFYIGYEQALVFAVEKTTLTAVPLPHVSIPQLSEWIDKLQFNIDCALKVAGQVTNLQWVAKRLGERLYKALLAPVSSVLQKYQRLIIVPYGPLHYLPFNLLRTNGRYLIEDVELVILPAAGLITREPVSSQAGARALAHSYHGRLPYVHREVQAIAQQFPTTMFVEEETGRDSLAASPVQILHLAAHGKQRLDHPELSYVQLADGQLFADDLFQRDMRYELVVLSACETGRAVVKAGEELIGLGRGVLNAGAGAVVSSMWRVEDETTALLMTTFYGELAKGASKATALRQAQLSLLYQENELHPAFWGAFQLVGDARPLAMFKDNDRAKSEDI